MEKFAAKKKKDFQFIEVSFNKNLHLSSYHLKRRAKNNENINFSKNTRSYI